MAQVTLPIAVVSEHYANRQVLLVIGQLVLIGAQIMLMEARTYWLMVLARILQGASSSVIWVLGLALVLALHRLSTVIELANAHYSCDTTHESIQGRKFCSYLQGISS